MCVQEGIIGKNMGIGELMGDIGETMGKLWGEMGKIGDWGNWDTGKNRENRGRKRKHIHTRIF